MLSNHELAVNGEYEKRDDVLWLQEIYGDRLHTERVVPDEYDGMQVYEFIADRLAENKLKHENAFNAVVMGSFDVPHPNHEWYLRDCRARAAERMLTNVFGMDVSEITPRDIAAALTYPGLNLTCIIDSDATLNKRKGGDPAKGGIERPVYAWRDRADRIAGYGYTGIDGANYNVVDTVIKEGIEFEGTPMVRIHKLAEKLKDNDLLDAYIVYGEYPQSRVNAISVGFDGPSLITIPTSTVYAVDPRTKHDYHSSDIIKRIRGGAK